MKGFTLAEVLITLGIVGIISAITIPGLITHYKKQTTVTKLKETYSILQQALKLYTAENEEYAIDTNLTAKQVYEKYFQKYIKTQQELTVNQKLAKVLHKELSSENAADTMCSWKNCSAGAAHFIILPNGALVMFGKQKTETGLLAIAVDINNFEKPNRVGIDTFSLRVLENGQILPFGYPGTVPDEANYKFSRDYIKNKGQYSRGCSKGKAGYFCQALIMYDGWEISKDYPWR
ncbi:MAG: type II secretion system GspH family protein [Muribaculaceae bacterium]|nr:type II secretion system GspH family protein [Muribaculaceae bacterium]